MPATGEQGFPAFAGVRTTDSLFASAATPPEVLDRLQKEVSAGLQMPDMKEILATQAATPVGNSIANFNQQVKREAQFWASLAKAINLRAE